MDNILFIYNIALTILFTVILTGFYFIYLKNREKVYLFLSLLYLCLIFDNTLVYISEFSKSFKVLYENSYLVYIIIYAVFLGIILTYRLIDSEIFQDKITKREILFFISLQIIILLLAVIDPYDISAEVIYFAFFIMLAYLSFKAYRNIRLSIKSPNVRKLYSYFILSVFIISIIAIVECAIFYLDDTITEFNASALDYRVISYDIMKILVCIFGLKYLVNSFDNMFKKKNIEDKLDDFCTSYAFTSRQREIIKLIIDGKSNKDISNLLHITEGTVKTHIHNIFRKADITSRNQILARIMNE